MEDKFQALVDGTLDDEKFVVLEIYQNMRKICQFDRFA